MGEMNIIDLVLRTRCFLNGGHKWRNKCDLGLECNCDWWVPPPRHTPDSVQLKERNDLINQIRCKFCENCGKTK